MNRKPENVSATIMYKKNFKMTLTVNQWKHNHIKLITRLQENFLIKISYEVQEHYKDIAVSKQNFSFPKNENIIKVIQKKTEELRDCFEVSWPPWIFAEKENNNIFLGLWIPTKISAIRGKINTLNRLDKRT